MGGGQGRERKGMGSDFAAVSGVGVRNGGRKTMVGLENVLSASGSPANTGSCQAGRHFEGE